MKILNVYAIALIGHHSGPGNWGPLGMNANDNDNDGDAGNGARLRAEFMQSIVKSGMD